MSDPVPDEQMEAAIQAANAMVASMERLVAELVELRKYGQRSRMLIRVLAASVVFDVLLSVGLGGVAWRANTAAHEAKRASSQAAIAKEANKEACRSSNTARATETDLWEYILTQPPSPDRPITPDQQIRIDQFRTYVHQAFAQRDCSG